MSGSFPLLSATVLLLLAASFTWAQFSVLSLSPCRRPGAPKGSKGATAYVRVSETEIADDYPAPQVWPPLARQYPPLSWHAPPTDAQRAVPHAAARALHRASAPLTALPNPAPLDCIDSRRSTSLPAPCCAAGLPQRGGGD